MIFLILCYLMIQIGIGYWVSKKIKNSGDFFLAGRNLPAFMVSISLVASWFGAESCIGTAGAVYKQGLSGSRADPFGYSLCLLLMGLLMAAPLWRGGYVTLSDFFAQRFGASVEKLTALILIPGSLIWGAAQVRAFGQIVSSATHLPVETTIVFCTVFVVAYTFLGGLLGDMFNDVLQGGMIFLGLFILFVVVYFDNNINWDFFAQMDPQRLSFMTADENIFQRIDRWAVPVLGSLVAQELISRTLASKSPETARSASITACLLYILLGSFPLLIGLIGPGVFPGVEDGEKFIIQLAMAKLPTVLYVLFIGALISAILSTIDTILLSVSAIASQNLIYPMFQPRSEKLKLQIARGLIIVSALIAYVIAHFSESIYSLVQVASSFGTSGLVVITLIGLYSNKGGAWAGISALVSGAVFFQIADKVLFLEAPFLSAIAAALLSYVTFAVIEEVVKRWPRKIHSDI